MVRLRFTEKIIMFFIFLRFYLFMRDPERERDRDREREKGRDTGRGRSRLHAGSPTWDLIWGLQDPGLKVALNCCTTGAALIPHL